MVGRKSLNTIGAFMMIRSNNAHDNMNKSGAVLVMVNLCFCIFCNVFRGSLERSKRCNAAVVASMRRVMDALGLVLARRSGVENMRYGKRDEYEVNIYPSCQIH